MNRYFYIIDIVIPSNSISDVVKKDDIIESIGCAIDNISKLDFINYSISYETHSATLNGETSIITMIKSEDPFAPNMFTHIFSKLRSRKYIQPIRYMDVYEYNVYTLYMYKYTYQMFDQKIVNSSIGEAQYVNIDHMLVGVFNSLVLFDGVVKFIKSDMTQAYDYFNKLKDKPDADAIKYEEV